MQTKFLPPHLRSKVPSKGDVAQLTPGSEELIAKRMVRELIPGLKAAGGRGLVEYPLNKIVP